MKTLLPIVCLALCASCSEDYPVEPTRIRPITVTTISQVLVTSNSVEFEIVCPAEPGVEYERSEIQQNGQDYLITIFARIPRVTLPVDESLRATCKVQLVSRGVHRFSFWRFDGTTTDTVIAVNRVGS